MKERLFTVNRRSIRDFWILISSKIHERGDENSIAQRYTQPEVKCRAVRCALTGSGTPSAKHGAWGTPRGAVLYQKRPPPERGTPGVIIRDPRVFLGSRKGLEVLPLTAPKTSPVMLYPAASLRPNHHPPPTLDFRH